MTDANPTRRCTKCGEAKPTTAFYKCSKTQCKECRKAYRKKHYQENRERILVWFRKYKRPKRNGETKRAWERKNRDRINAAHRKMYASNPEKFKKLYREWCRKNLHIKRAQYQRRRARKLGAEGNYTPTQVRELFKKQQGRCACCSKKLLKYHEDHITPLSKGGSNAIYNIQLLCPRCNLTKSDKDPIEHARRIGRLI